jgi:lipoprotein-anchoring transpeptidase ErfK/SrfK
VLRLGKYLVLLAATAALVAFLAAYTSAPGVSAQERDTVSGILGATASPDASLDAAAANTTPTTATTVPPAPSAAPQGQGTGSSGGTGTTTPAAAPAASSASEVPASTVVATLRGDVPGSPAPGALSTQTVPGSWYGYPSILPVIAAKGRWLEVRLAQRPNESTAWIPRSAVTTSTVAYAVVVNLSTERLTVYQSGQPVLSFPAGIGSPASPTPPGTFFITMTAPAPDPGYGPFVLVTSAHSDAITDWENSGDAIIAIHGPIDAIDDALIGTTGAAISSGCVRLHDADLAQLSMLPAGTPVDIVTS